MQIHADKRRFMLLSGNAVSAEKYVGSIRLCVPDAAKDNSDLHTPTPYTKRCLCPSTTDYIQTALQQNGQWSIVSWHQRDGQTKTGYNQIKHYSTHALSKITRKADHVCCLWYLWPLSDQTSYRLCECLIFLQNVRTTENRHERLLRCFSLLDTVTPFLLRSTKYCLYI